MIMGYSGQASSWGEPFLERLRPHFSTIRFSNRGTGLSDNPEVATTIRMMAEDSVALMDALGITRAHVLGISMGGMIAQELVLNHPQRVQGLVLGCTLPGGTHSVPATPETMSMVVPVAGLSSAELFRRAWPAICTASFIETRRDFLDEMLQAGLQNPTPLATLARQMAAIQAFDTFDRLPQIKAPTLVIHGDADLLVPPENGRLLAERIAGAVHREISGAAHMFFWEQPQAAASAIVEFLARVPAAA
jgi:pimeloyl-ACP methyl ester carboxylesterase